jgi:hypothetical protein
MPGEEIDQPVRGCHIGADGMLRATTVARQMILPGQRGRARRMNF